MYWYVVRFKYKYMLISGHFHVFSIWKPHFQCNANWKLPTTSPCFCNEPHLLHVLFMKVVPGTTFTSRSKHHFDVIGKAEQQVRKASHCCTKKQWKSHVVIIRFLLVRATWVLFIMHIPLGVNRTFNTMLIERLQHLQQGWARLFVNDWEWKRQVKCNLNKLRYK